MPYQLLNGVAAAPNGGHPIVDVYYEQIDPTRQPCDLTESLGGDNYRVLFRSMAAWPQLPYWQP